MDNDKRQANARNAFSKRGYENIEYEFYENKWKSLKGTFSGGKNEYTSREPSRAIEEFTVILTKSKANGNVLDVGCGNGRNIIPFAKKGFITYGIDISPSAIRIARKNAKDNNVNVSFKVESVFRPPYLDGAFDAVIDSGCLHHLRKSEWKEYIRNITRVLKQEGHYLLTGFSENYAYTPGFSPKNNKRKWTLRNGHYNIFFSDKMIRDAFSKKFSILQSKEIILNETGAAFKVYTMKKK